jgi:prevent-host-death family protein
MREFRTHLSAIVRRVRDNGETFEITRRGKPVAILRPIKPWEKKLSGIDNVSIHVSHETRERQDERKANNG